jgi:glycogen synthase
MYFESRFLIQACGPEEGGDLAYYFDDFDPRCMQAVFENGMHDYECKRPQEKIIQRAKSFNWKNAADEYLDVYRKFLDK